MSRMIYVVYGRTGEGGDHMEWPVRAFYSEIDAAVHQEELLKLARSLGCLWMEVRDFPIWDYARIPDLEKYVEFRADWEKLKSMDPQFRTDYTGTEYRHYSVPYGPQ